MAADATSASMTLASMSLAQAAEALAWPAKGKVQSSQGMTATRAMSGANRGDQPRRCGAGTGPRAKPRARNGPDPRGAGRFSCRL